MEVGGIIGIYGAIVSTGLLIWNILRDRPKVSLKINPIYALDHDGIICKEVEVIVINKSREPIRIEEVGFTMFASFPISFMDRFTFSPSYFDLPEILVIKGRDKQVFKISAKVLEQHASGTAIEYYWVKDATDKLYQKKIPKGISHILDFELKP
ncbi:hypothetical protein ACFLWI_00055 [Chloroflexota bacterium]